MRKEYTKILFAIMLLCSSLLVSAQPSSVIDSLQNSLVNAVNREDSVFILSNLARNINRSDPDLTYKYSMKALELSKDIKDQELIAIVYESVGTSYAAKSDYTNAKEYFEKELVIARADNIKARIAHANYNLADISLREKKNEDAYTYALKSRAVFKELNNILMVIRNDRLLLKATAKGKTNPYADLIINDYELSASLTNDPNTLLDRCLNLIYMYGQKENKSKSMFYAMKALDIAEEVNDQKAIMKSYYPIANYLKDYQHNYDVALLYYNKILDIYKEKKSDSGVAGALLDIGDVHRLMGDDSLAMTFYNKSLGIAERINYRHAKANAYKSIGEICYLKKHYNEALSYYLKCYDTGCDKCPPIVFHKVLIDVGNVYLNEKDYANAEKYFRKSLALADSANADYERASSYSALADIKRSQNNNNAAINYYHTALRLATNVNSLSLQKDISSKLSNAYRQQNNFRKAFEYLDLSNAIADSLSKISEVENLSRIETKFEFENIKAQKEIELKESRIKSNAEIDQQKQLTYFFVFGFILVSAFGSVVYVGYRRKRKDNAILEHQKIQLEELSEKIHEVDQKKISFFTNISHELRTPLTLILGPVEKLLKENSDSNGSSSLLSIVRRNTLQLYNLINQLLDIRKLDTGNVRLKITAAEVVSYVKGIYSTFIHLAQEKNITYIFNTDVDQINCWFDKDIIEKTLNNLLSNAFKYTPKHGKINVTISSLTNPNREITHVKIVIADNGKGIPEDQVQYVFDRYYQVENTNTGFNTGTGIGLAYSRELIELHKGEINIESKIDHGTVFTIVLPVHESYYSINEKSNGNAYPLENSNIDIRQSYLEQLIEPESVDDLTENNSNEELEVMLIVEDNTDLRTFIKSIFADSYKILEEPDGATGYQTASEIIPDVIISDIMMPGMNGLELCTKLKSNIHTNHIPLLILTAKTGEENELSGLKSGADDYLTKPFSSEILEMRVKRLIESRERLRRYFTREFLLNPKEIKLASPEDEFLKRAVKIVEENISDPNLNVNMLMNELSVSRTQLFRKLKAITNYSANQFIRNIKLKRAAQLLQNKSYNITEVLYLSGFNSPSYFTSCFKEMYGCLPKEYHSKTDDGSALIN